MPAFLPLPLLFLLSYSFTSLSICSPCPHLLNTTVIASQACSDQTFNSCLPARLSVWGSDRSFVCSAFLLARLFGSSTYLRDTANVLRRLSGSTVYVLKEYSSINNSPPAGLKGWSLLLHSSYNETGDSWSIIISIYSKSNPIARINVDNTCFCTTVDTLKHKPVCSG